MPEFSIDPRPLAEQLIEQFNLGELRSSTCPPDVVAWHNYDDRDVLLATGFASLNEIRRQVSELRFDVVQILEVDAQTSVARYVLRVTTKEGRSVAIPGCVIVTGRDGIIRRVDEYLDSGQLAPIMSLLVT